MVRNDSANMSIPTQYQSNGPLTVFQSNVARRWLQRGEQTKDPFAQFFFFFTGFNALYFLWARLDKMANEQGEVPNEGKQIENLVGKFGEDSCKVVLDSIEAPVIYFVCRPPIQEMRKRDVNRDVGDSREGKRLRNKLESGSTAQERLVAMARILYLVRSNLFHGSKAESGDDHEIVVNSVAALKELLRESIEMTQLRTI